MSISPTCGPRRTFQSASPLLFAIAAGLFGCANPGPPKPPTLNLPAPVKDLRAERIGGEVRLAWTTPSDTTDDVAIKLPLSAEICREAFAPSLPITCIAVQHLPVKPGPSAATDPLPAPLLVDPVTVLRYRVRVLNASGRAADASSSAFAASGAAPSAVSDLRSSSSPEGTRILWRPENSPPAAVTLQRTATSAVPAAAKPGTTPAVQQKQAASAVVQLQASTAGSDRGGTVDTSAQRGAIYRYAAWRSRSVVVAGKSLSLRSPDSAPLVITIRDTTPPATPVGLEAVADDNGFVDLSWEPDIESDLAGYWIERAELPASADRTPSESASSSEPWARQNPTPISVPAFRDVVPPGAHRYRYRVLAVDSTGNLSAPTPPVTVSVRSGGAP